MDFIIATSDFSGLGMAMRLEQEGHSAILAIPSPAAETETSAQTHHFQLVGNGLVDKRPLAEVLARRSELRQSYWIWDGNHSVRENELLRREGFRVFGGGLFPDLMEHDRDFALRYCASYGLNAPPSHRFTAARPAIAFLEHRCDTAFVFKPDRGRAIETWVPDDIDAEEANLQLRQRLQSCEPTGPFILQEKKRGVEANVEVWFVQGEPKFALMLLECKRKHNGDRGEMTGCALDFIFPIPLHAKAVLQTVGKLFPAYRRMRYTGFGDANVIIDGDDFWLLEKCERFGYNAHANLLWSLNRDELGTTLAGLAEGNFRPNFLDAYGASVTVFNESNSSAEVLTIPDDILSSIYFWDVYRDGGRWMTAGYDSSVLMVAAAGGTPFLAWNSLMERVHRLECSAISFRTDGTNDGYANSPVERLAALQEMELI
jgi:phosphoribosylamine-glycine ligase